MSSCPFCREAFGAPSVNTKQLSERNNHIEKCADHEVGHTRAKQKQAIQQQVDLYLNSFLRRRYQTDA